TPPARHDVRTGTAHVGTLSGSGRRVEPGAPHLYPPPGVCEGDDRDPDRPRAQRSANWLHQLGVPDRVRFIPGALRSARRSTGSTELARPPRAWLVVAHRVDRTARRAAPHRALAVLSSAGPAFSLRGIPG